MKSTKPESSKTGQLGHGKRAEDLTLRIGTSLAVPEVLRSLGSDPIEVLSELGIDIKLFDNPNNRFTYLERGRLFEHCANRTTCPHFGLLIGQKTGLSSFGLVGLLTEHSPDVGSALHSLMRYMHLHVRGAVTTLSMDSDLAVLEYKIYQPRALGNDQVGDGAVAVAFNILRGLCGSNWVPVEVRFAHNKPKNVTPFRQFFQVPLRFDTEQYAVVFSATWLNRRLSNTNPELLGLLQREIDKLELRQSDNIQERVRTVLRTTLVTGHHSADQIAELFSMSRRTLNRHLNALGTTYQELVDETRFEIAQQLLEDSAMEVIEIADLLGYSNASAFTRAFRRWSSTTPARWRLTANGSSYT